jgi:guanylate kinase/SAM-dependent methyltransferase
METSISYYIRDPVPFVVLGGLSGVGKTSLIEALFEAFPSVFEQPLSYTTRPRRYENDRYLFISVDRIRNMHQRGELLNLDEAHGHFYGMAEGAVQNLQAEGKIPIKEIHPKNFQKLTTAGLNVVKVLVENRHQTSRSKPFVLRQGREEDDFDIENYSDYDIRLNIAGMNAETAAHYLIRRLVAFRLHTRLYPHPQLIEEANKKGYDAISTEFRDELRITTKNFHDASMVFWNRALAPLTTTPKGMRVLELGPGNGWLFSKISPREHEIDALDLSERMEVSYARHVFRCSARHIPVEASFYDLVVGSLVDPLLTPEVFIEIDRVLKPGGKMVITTPSWEWASNLSGRVENKTAFQRIDGTTVEVFSFCDPLITHLSIKAITDLRVLEVNSLSLGGMYEHDISPAIVESSLMSGKDARSLPIVTGLIFEKTK